MTAPVSKKPFKLHPDSNLTWCSGDFPHLLVSDCDYVIFKTGLDIVDYIARNPQGEKIGLAHNSKEAIEICEKHYEESNNEN